MFILQRANLSAMIGVKPLTGRVDVCLGKSKPVSQDWGKDADGSCLRKSKPVSQDWGRVVDGSCRCFCWKEQTCQPGLG